jgi:hypothetical protein
MEGQAAGNRHNCRIAQSVKSHSQSWCTLFSLTLSSILVAITHSSKIWGPTMKKTCRRPVASLSRTLALAMGGSLILASGLSACQTRRYNSATKTAQSGDEAGVYSACMGMQGNGVLFSSHIGTLIALFENSIDPKVIVGGSSGSIVGSIGRALMNNSSIRNTPVEYITPSGEKILLTTPQKAALILAAAEDAMNGFLFLPGLDSFTQGQYLQYILGFAANLKAGQLPDQAHFKIMNIESTVGSAVLIVAFFQLYNFSGILGDSNMKLASPKPDYLGQYIERKNAMYSAFAQYTGAKQWTVAKLIGLLSDPSLMNDSNLSTLSDETTNPLDRLDNGSDKEKIQAQRLRDLIKFKTLQSEDRDFVKEPSTAEDLLEHKDMMHRWWSGTGLRLTSNALKFVNTGVQNSSQIVTTNRRDDEFKTYSNRLLNGRFLIPDPDLVMQAYQGMVPDPKDPTKPQFFPVPKGMIIHSTFRRGRVKKEPLESSLFSSKAQESSDKYVVGFESKTGFDSLYQGYIVGESLDGSGKGSNNSILNQMLDRRNKSWSEFKKSNNQFWRKPMAEVVGSNYSNAAFMLYTRGNLEGSRSSISNYPVANFKSDPPESMLPRNSDLRDDEFESYMNPNRILIFNQGTKSDLGDFRNRGLNFGIQASAGEPGAFRRYAIKWTPNDIKLNSLDGEPAVPLENLQGQVLAGFEDAQVIPFGGWGENVPLSSVAHLDECQKASIFVTSGLDAPGNDFQAGAILASLAGNFETESDSETEESPRDLMSRI